MATKMRAFVLGGSLSLAALVLSPLPSGDGLSWHYGEAIAQSAGSAEKDAFEAAKALGTVEAWNAFLKNYSTGFHADLARAYVRKLGPSTAPAAAVTTSPAPPAPTPGAAAAIAPPAHELPCSDAKKIHSERSDQPAKIRFVNESGSTLVIQWIDFNSALKEYAVLQPGTELTQDTFITHPWIAAYQEGSCRQFFLPGEGLSIARLLPESQLLRAAAPSKSSENDHGSTSSKTCRDIGKIYSNGRCVTRKSSTPSKATVEKRAKTSCADIGMIYLNGKCQPKTKKERNQAEQNKSKPCPAGTYRNPYGKCQPNETGG